MHLCRNEAHICAEVTLILSVIMEHRPDQTLGLKTIICFISVAQTKGDNMLSTFHNSLSHKHACLLTTPFLILFL